MRTATQQNSGITGEYTAPPNNVETSDACEFSLAADNQSRMCIVFTPPYHKQAKGNGEQDGNIM